LLRSVVQANLRSAPVSKSLRDTGAAKLRDMSNHLCIHIIASLLFCAFHCAGASNAVVRAGARYTVDVWETDDGLPQNSVITMTQTRDGYLWLGTLNGLVRFDGFRFTVFDENNTPGLGSSRIVKLFEDSKGGLWVGTEAAGIALVKDGQLTSPPEIGHGGSERRLSAACEDSTGAVWLYNANGELWRYWNGRFAPFLFGWDSPSACRAIIAETAGPVWIGTDRRQSAVTPGAVDASLDLPVTRDVPVKKLDFLLASKRDGYWRLADGHVQKWTTNRLERDLGPYPWSRAPVSAACEDQDGNLVVGTLGAGVFWFDAGGKTTRLSTTEGLSYNYILSLLVDREGTLWVGTDGGGLNRVKHQVFDLVEETRNLVVQSVSEADRGGLWIGFNAIGEDAQGAGFWREGTLKRYGFMEGLENSSVMAVFADRNQRVWVGTLAGLFQLQNGQFQRVTGLRPVYRGVLALHQDRSGRLWAGTQGGLARWDGREWRVFTTRDGLSADEVRAIVDDPEGNLWIGTKGGGLNRLQNGRFSSYHKADGVPSEDISSLIIDGDGVLWVGTSGGGLGRFHAGEWTRYTMREGLISNRLGYLIEDEQGYLWIGSAAGLMRVPKNALNDFARKKTSFIPCRAYTKLDGLPTRECTVGSQPGAWRTRDGKLWFPTIKGLVSINPAQLNPNTNPPPVTLESVLIDGQVQNTNRLRAWPQTVRVRPGSERLEIHFTSLNLTAPDRASFKYRLEGHESDWIEAGNTRVARYSKLPPGEYRFQVTACNEDGVWNPTGSSFAIIVETPLWQTWWFLSAATFLSLGAFVGVVHYLSTQKLHRQLESLRQREAIEKERARIARDIHDQLGANLTQVSLLGELVESDKDSPDDVEAHAQQISQTARETTRALDEIVWTVNPSNDTLDGLITYVCKYAQDYFTVAGLRHRLDVPAQLPGGTISPEIRHNVFLAFKEAVTNVVRHARAASVWLRLKLEADQFTLVIEDDGRGLSDGAETTGRNGLRNMRKRMEDIGGDFSIGPTPGGGTTVRLTAPIGKR
jgi:ligand-binding sensor domain-containing protein/signal transduction histidine kinase